MLTLNPITEWYQFRNFRRVRSIKVPSRVSGRAIMAKAFWEEMAREAQAHEREVYCYG